MTLALAVVLVLTCLAFLEVLTLAFMRSMPRIFDWIIRFFAKHEMAIDAANLDKMKSLVSQLPQAKQAVVFSLTLKLAVAIIILICIL